MQPPRITVLIDTYNQEGLIEQAVVSALEQDTSASFEVLVVDDGSTDRTPEILTGFGSRIRCLWKKNGGQASAFNAAIPEARGEIVAFLDGDDWWPKNKLQQVMEVFDNDPCVGVVGHGYYEVTARSSRSERVLPDRTYRIQMNDPDSASLFDAMQTFFGTSKLSGRTAILRDLMPIPQELEFSADRFLYTLAAATAGAAVLDTPLCYYRVHEGNLFMTQDPERVSRSQDIQSLVTDKLGLELAARHIPANIIDALLEPHRLLGKRIRLSRNGGSPWETFRVERAAYDSSNGHHGFADSSFHALVLSLALLMPPKSFYQLKRWYWDKRLGRYRGKSYRDADFRIRRESASAQPS